MHPLRTFALCRFGAIALHYGILPPATKFIFWQIYSVGEPAS
jgi:hypothetical protein